MRLVPRKDQLVNLYLDINPITNKLFYVGIGVDSRLRQFNRNKYHKKIVESLPDKKFIRKVLYKNINIEKAWRIEKQIIKKCGRIIYKNGFLANIHEGGPLPIEDKNGVHWAKGKKLQDIFPDYINHKLGKTYDELYGERKYDILRKRTESRKISLSKRLKEKGKTEKEIEAIRIRIERRKNKQFTENELKSFVEQSKRQTGRTMKERLNNLKWIDPRKGKSAIEIYGENYKGPANKGKTQKEFHGPNYIDPRSKPFTIQVNNENPIICESEKDFCKKFNCNDVLLRKFKENGEWKITRQSNSKHTFSNNSIVKFDYIK